MYTWILFEMQYEFGSYNIGNMFCTVHILDNNRLKERMLLNDDTISRQTQYSVISNIHGEWHLKNSGVMTDESFRNVFHQFSRHTFDDKWPGIAKIFTRSRIVNIQCIKALLRENHSKICSFEAVPVVVRF